MTTPEQIKSWIEAGMSTHVVEVTGDGQHFEAVVVSKDFQGESTLTRHRRVYAALGDKMHSVIHALSMRTLTCDEWANQ